MMSNSMIRKLLSAFAAPFLWLAAAPAALADWELNMTQGVTAVSRDVYSLHMLILGICCVIAVIVFGAMIISIISHRKSKGVTPATFSHSTKAEIVWTIIPILILVGMAVPAAGTLIRMEDTRNSDLSIKVTAYQWKWRYDYIDEGFGFFSNLSEDANIARRTDSGIDPATIDNYLRDVDNPMVVPVGAKVRLLLTAADVIHSWWVPDFGGKKDAIPGFVNEFWFQAEEPGVYRGQCAELCGRDHAFMPVVVEVLPVDEYKAWVSNQAVVTDTAEQPAPAQEEPAVAVAAVDEGAVEEAADETVTEWSMDLAMSQGETAYTASCAACHQPNGQGMPPVFPPLAGSPIATGDVAQHINIVVNGKPGTAMAAFGPQLDDETLAAIITYQRNAWGNDTGDLVNPADVAAAR